MPVLYAHLKAAIRKASYYGLSQLDVALRLSVIPEEFRKNLNSLSFQSAAVRPLDKPEQATSVCEINFTGSGC